MTREELVGLIDGIRDNYKEGDNLSKDDLYKIGLAHRHLPKGERSWSWLLSLTGGFSSSEAYRNFVLNRLKKNNFVEDAISSEGKAQLDDYTVQKNELFKERQKLRDERTTINKSLRESARFDALKELIKESIGSLPKLKEFKNDFKYAPKKESEAILMLSDWHIGQDCSNFYNKFNLDVAKDRVSNLIDKTIEYCKTFKIKTLNVLNLGDLIEGKINNSGRIESNERTLNQLMYATEMMANALNKLSAYIPNVIYRSVTDNHSNIDSNYKDRIEEENLNLITTWYLKARLKDTKVHIVEDNLDPSLGRFELSNGMKVAFFHGHRDPKDKILQNLVGATHEWTDIVCSGHLHNPAEHVFQDMRLFVNGSLCGTGSYALNHRLFTTPSQKLIIINSGDFLNFDISVDN